MRSRIRNKRHWLIVLGILGLACFSLTAQEKTLVIQNARILTISKGIVDKGDIIIRNGKIESIGASLSFPENAEIINAQGLTAMPGLFDSFTNLGAAEISSFGTDDDEATSAMMPQLRITDGVNPDNRWIPMAVQHGVTTIHCAPGEGNLITGQSAVLRLSGETVEDMTLSFPAGISCTMGEEPKKRYGSKEQAPMTRMGIAALLRQTFLDVQEYQKKRDDYKKKKTEDKDSRPPEIDMKNHALMPLLKQEVPFIISACRYDDILTALRITKEFELKLILNHGTEAYRIAEILKIRQIPVIVGPTLRDHLRQETMKAVPDLARRLDEAGVKIAFQTGGIDNVTGLLNQARHAVANGLSAETALKALTLNPAEIFGVSHRLGSLETGKDADIILLDGDPLEMLTKIKTVIIAGCPGRDIN